MFKNLIADADDRLLGRGMDEDAVKKMLRPVRQLLNDHDFWKNGSEGLSVFVTPTELRWYRLHKPFGPTLMIGPRFFVKPLLAMIEPHDRFYVLSLNQKRIRLWEGDVNTLREMELKAMPTNLAEALRFHDRDEPLEYHTQKVGGHWNAIFHGQGVGIDTVKDDLLVYFQKIDRGLHEYLSPKAPLILAGVEYLWPIYRKANRHPRLFEKGIAGNTEQLSARQLHEKAWGLVSAEFERPMLSVRDQYAALAGTGRTCKEAGETIRAACEGRLETLLVALDREAWGIWDAGEGQLMVHPQRMNGDEDLLNVAAINAAAHGAKVFVLPTREMPDANPVAGIYWLPAAKHR